MQRDTVSSTEIPDFPGMGAIFLHLCHVSLKTLSTTGGSYCFTEGNIHGAVLIVVQRTLQGKDRWTGTK